GAAEFRGCAARVHDGSGPQDALGRGVGHCVDMILQQQRALGCSATLERSLVLYGYRNSFEQARQARRVSVLRLLGAIERLVEVAHGQGVDLWVDLLASRNDASHQFDW